MAALYLGPLAVTNCWLVMYTWLQHTEVQHSLSQQKPAQALAKFLELGMEQQGTVGQGRRMRRERAERS